ncbi:hypothetical protein GQ43DRAFT_133224 [Delitschia confertaspora ATCC 74209]|uniref:Uncharacterized protein n=1 Tax=Delitschia confertaspora ATCC 74209 TaxID=1513339 RepID=A0A9P4MWK1_9PLEO|nr:hypothetical protein GQ43DRAFT_133224 [Delitschia confertaspora ATCC 74209]
MIWMCSAVRRSWTVYITMHVWSLSLECERISSHGLPGFNILRMEQPVAQTGSQTLVSVLPSTGNYYSPPVASFSPQHECTSNATICAAANPSISLSNPFTPDLRLGCSAFNTGCAGRHQKTLLSSLDTLYQTPLAVIDV